MTQKTFKRGDRVRVRPYWVRGRGECGGKTGTVLIPPEEPGQNGVAFGLYAVLSDDGSFNSFAPNSLELCAECGAEEGLLVAIRCLHEKREDLFHDLLCLVAASRRIDLRDSSARQQVEAEVKEMSADWSCADAAALRRKEFSENTELRKRLIGSLTKYLELADLIQQLTELLDGDPSDAPVECDQQAR